MKRKHVLGGLCISLLLAASCSLPPGSVVSDTAEVQKPTLAVETDISRAQGVYVNEKGERFDIVSPEGSDGAPVSCVEATQILEMDQQSAAKGLSPLQPAIKAIVLGRRADGYPGVWLIHAGDRIHPLEENDCGHESSKLGDASELSWQIHGFYGWVYHADLLLGPDSGGGYIVVGYAENEKGVDLGRWKIQPNTTVAVYWRLTVSPKGRYRLSRARIIGEPSMEYAGQWAHTEPEFPSYQHRDQVFKHLRKRFASFQLFVLDWFDPYLTKYSSARYDDGLGVYQVTGPVKGTGITAENQIGIATIQLGGAITIALLEPPSTGTTYARIVIETYPYSQGAAATDTTLRLYDADGKELAYNENVVATDPIYPSARIDHTAGLAPGIYYIRINSDAANFGPYVVRVLSLKTGEALPAYDYPGAPAVENWPDADDPATGNIPAAPLGIQLGSLNRLNRRLTTEPDHANDVPPHDVDWLKLELP
jgi:hypothetical protein